MDSPDRSDQVEIDTSLVECIVVSVPDASSVASVAAALAELVASAAIRVLDLVAVKRSRRTHEVRVLELEELDEPARALVEEHLGGLLSANDIALASAALLPGGVGVLVVVEDRWAGALSSAARRAGGRVIGGGRISESRLEAVLAEPPSPVLPNTTTMP
jgi:hypothetical protein